VLVPSFAADYLYAPKNQAETGIRSRQLQHQNIKDQSDINDALAEAFEKGYRLGRTDGREGVFIDMPSLVSQFTDSLAVNIKQDE
jgi:flagellar biosynthesis/type III secretory pathway protein FliH